MQFPFLRHGSHALTGGTFPALLVRVGFMAMLTILIGGAELVANERIDTVREYLAAGEFQNAVREAKQSFNMVERNEMLKEIAQAQAEAGEFEAASALISELPTARQRVQERGEQAARRSLAGTGADFESLIQLIMNETEGPWEEIEGVGGTITEFETGIRVDPQGLLGQVSKTEQDNRLRDLGMGVREADLNTDMSTASPLRMVSLTRLEQAVAEQIANGQPVVESMKNLAGLSQIQYIFVYPEEGEVVIAGPASGWSYAANGWPVSTTSERPTLQLDDLVTVMRTFSNEGMNIFGCSINPRQEGMRQLKEYAEASLSRGPLRSTQVRGWVRKLQEKLGLQDIEIYGVPSTSRVARVIVEADYRMKMIGIGKLDAGSKIPDYFELMSVEQQKSVGSLDALRWWLTMKYDQVLHSENRNAFELRGASVLCQSENQFITAQGQRIQTGQSEATNRLFAANFTEHFEELAQRDVVFADLQNVFDLAMVAALLQREQVGREIDWDGGVFANGGAYQTEVYDAPEEVESVVNHRVFRGRDIVVQVAGGVRADLMSVLKNQQVTQASPRLKNVAKDAKAPQLPEGRWWWDAAK